MYDVPGSSVRPRQRLMLAGVAFLVCVLVVLGVWRFLVASQRHTQMQEDPEVATVWEIGVTRGPHQVLTRGSVLQRWLSAHGISALGTGSTLTSSYSGDPGGMEIWFDYNSHLPRQSNLECHRVGVTAFTDDLGQPYHGYLDFHGRVVGVYLSGYDHSAHQITCELRWMPRKPAMPYPVSHPMSFTVDLPSVPRLLPRADTLPRGPVVQTQRGVTVTLRAVRLGAPKLELYKSSQRELTFRFKIEGGVLANSNVGDFSGNMSFRTLRITRGRFGFAIQPRILPPPNPTGPRFVITDPYGISLVPEAQNLYPPQTAEELQDPLEAGKDILWVAPVNNAGRGTDAVRMQFDVRPTQPAHAPTVHFDMTIPVETGGDV